MKRSTKKKKILLWCGILLATAILFNITILCYDVFSHSGGVVTKISAKATGNSTITLKLNYALPSGGYSVRNVSPSEGEYTGDGMIDYGGSLGKYRVIIEFGDAEPSAALSKKLAPDQALKTSSANLQIKIAHPSDHGFVLYIGSDTPISVEPIENGHLKSTFGVIKIPIKLNAE